MAHESVGGTESLQARLTKWGYMAVGRSLEGAIALYQANHASSLTELTRQYHGRDLRVDGDIGPATAQIINSRFCDVPDVMPGSLALEGPAEARWPDSCKDDITVSWNFAAFPGLTSEQTIAVWLAMEAEYERLFDLNFSLRGSANYGQSRINARLEAMGSGILAWSYLADNSCSSRLEQAYSNRTWSPKLAEGTDKHEVGHALGMNHTPGDHSSIMYPSINGQTMLNATDINQMVSLGYKRRTTPIADWSMF